MNVRDLFRAFSQRVSDKAGSAWAFFFSLLAILVWLLDGLSEAAAVPDNLPPDLRRPTRW